jgi:hypothetical protein
MLCIAVAGGIGGVVNALIADRGFFPPRKEQMDNVIIWRPGWIGNVIIGVVSAIVSWGLYGPLAAYFIVGPTETLNANLSPEKIGLTLSSLVGAMLIGVGGARWLTNEVDKNLLRATASKAAGAKSDMKASKEIALATPMQAFNIAMRLK